MQFLMGLDYCYQPVRSSLLKRDPLPEVKDAYNVVSREESRRGIPESSGVIEFKMNATSFAAKSFNRPNPNLNCKHCGKIDHTIERCYELVGFPIGFKRTSNSVKQGFNANVDVKKNEKMFSGNPSSSFTSEQMQKLLSLINETPTASIHANMADSGVNQHLTISTIGMSNIVDISELKIIVGHPNGTLATISHVGDLKLSNNVTLYDVLVVPGYCVSLLSVNKLIRDSKVFVGFDENTCYIQDWKKETVLGTGSESDGLYVFDVNNKCSNGKSNLVMSFHVSKFLWHNRLGHPANQVLSVLKNDLSISKDTSVPVCEVCHRAKQTREPFPLSDHKSKTLGELVHLDLWGPYRVSSREGAPNKVLLISSSLVGPSFPKVLNPKVVSDYRPISLIGSLYKVVTKILATRLSMVISDLISDVQTTFLPNRQILDGLFIINEILARCKLKKQQAMIFKVDFAKAYDSIRWDFLDDVLNSFDFGSKWYSWIRGSLSSGKASILVNGSPTSEFHLHRGLKQGDPLAPFLFILIMKSLHLLFSRAVEAGIFTGFRIDPSITLSHLFYADDAVFIGEWSHANLKGIMNILRCFSLLSGMSINIQKSHLLGVGDNMSSIKAWDETITKMKKRLSKWKLNTLSIGGRLTLLKSVLGSTPIYNMSIFKHSFPRLYALEENKDLSVANKIHAPITSSFRRPVRGGVESQQLDHLLELLGSVILSNMEDRWFWNLNGVGVFRVKDVRNLLDESFLPKVEVPTRWIKSIPIKVNVFAWKLFLDRLPTRSNLARRNVTVPSLAWLRCGSCSPMDSSHLFLVVSVTKGCVDVSLSLIAGNSVFYVLVEPMELH
ncbi:RNA-directed DNA polymerase, eukaryota [Tanacetum coccineum]